MRAERGGVRPLLVEREVGRIVGVLEQIVDEAARLGARRLQQPRQAGVNFGH